MILLMMELKGRFNSKMIKKAKFGDVYFDEMGGFESVEKDRVTGNVNYPLYVSVFILTLLSFTGCRTEGSYLQTYSRSKSSVNATGLGEN